MVNEILCSRIIIMWLVVSDFVLCGFSKHSHLEQISCYDYTGSRLCVEIVATWQILKKLNPYIRSAALDHGLIVFFQDPRYYGLLQFKLSSYILDKTSPCHKLRSNDGFLHSNLYYNVLGTNLSCLQFG